MADPVKPKRRMVKKAETIREKAEKQGQPKPVKRGTLRKVLQAVSLPFRWIGRQIAKLGRFKVFRVLGRILWPTYFRNSWKELKQVTWPTGRETIQLTFAVMVFAAIFGVMIAIVDFGLDKLFREVLLK